MAREHCMRGPNSWSITIIFPRIEMVTGSTGERLFDLLGPCSRYDEVDLGSGFNNALDTHDE